MSNEQYFFGAKECLNITKIGVCATTIAGEQAVGKHYEVYFEDADLILIPDNDQPGRRNGKSRVQILSVVKRLRWLELPNLLKGDASDWIKNEQGIQESLDKLLRERFEWTVQIKALKNFHLKETEEELIRG